MVTFTEGRNRPTASEAGSFFEELDLNEQRREVKLAELDAEFKAKKRALNKSFNDEQKPIYDDAKKQGVPKNVLRALVNGQAGMRKAHEKDEAARERADKLIDDLEPEERDYAVDIHTALGDDYASFGLGAVAAAREETKPSGKKKAAKKAEADKGEPDPVAAAAGEAWGDTPSTSKAH